MIVADTTTRSHAFGLSIAVERLARRSVCLRCIVVRRIYGYDIDRLVNRGPRFEAGSFRRLRMRRCWEVGKSFTRASYLSVQSLTRIDHSKSDLPCSYYNESSSTLWDPIISKIDGLPTYAEPKYGELLDDCM